MDALVVAFLPVAELSIFLRYMRILFGYIKLAMESMDIYFMIVQAASIIIKGQGTDCILHQERQSILASPKLYVTCLHHNSLLFIDL